MCYYLNVQLQGQRVKFIALLKFDLNLRKKTYGMLLIVAIRSAEMWTLRKIDENCVENFETCCWKNFIVREQKINMTFIGPCIVIYFYSKTNKMHQFFKFILFWNNILHVSDNSLFDIYLLLYIQS